MLDTFLLVLSILLFISIWVGKLATKLGVPVLVFFLSVGMLFGSDGLGIQFNDLRLAEAIGTISLCIILFAGGLNTKFEEVKPVIGPSLVLATLGVVLTALIAGLFAWWLFGELIPTLGLTLLSAFLMTSIMSSTDSAAVFSVLSSKNVQLKHNLGPALELESGSNDPLAYMLTISLIGLIKVGGEPNIPMLLLSILIQFSVGGAVGLLFGKLGVGLLNAMKIKNEAFYPIVIFTCCIFIFSFTQFIGGNGFLAVYIGGMMIGNSRFVEKRMALKFFDAIAWLSQILMFLMLGLLVNPHELLNVAVPAMLLGMFMVFVARPLSVFICLSPFGKRLNYKDKLFISWVGLRGAVPIIFAIYPLTAGIPHARFIFNAVFFITLLSVLLQGTLLNKVAEWLDLLAPPKYRKRNRTFDIELSEDIDSISTEIQVGEHGLRNGDRLMDLPLPNDVLVVMVRRGDKYFVPNGKSELKIGDKLLLMMNDEESLQQTYDEMGITHKGSLAKKLPNK